MQSRQKVIQQIGSLTPSINSRNSEEVNFSSIFIIPIPHKIHDLHRHKEIQQFFTDVEKNWDIKNNTIENDLFLYDIKQYIKNSIFEKIDLSNEKEKNNFIYDQKSLYLTHKQKDIALTYCGLKVCLKEIDLWIMDENIAFFTYKIERAKEHLYDINTLSTKINRDLRDFRYLSIDIQKGELFYRKEDTGVNLLEYFMSLTINKDTNSFLNVSYKQNRFDVSEDFSVIHASTNYAKTITALHVDEDTVTIDGVQEQIAPIAQALSENVIVDVGILPELSYLLATTSAFDFKKELSFVANEGYAYPLIKDNGINIWKYWSAIALQDTLAFFSIKHGGDGIVSHARTSNYFIYMTNL